MSLAQDRWTMFKSSLRNPMYRSRMRWLGTGWVIAGINVFLGGGYLIHGLNITAASGVFAAFDKVPGGLRAHGVVCLVLGIALAVCLRWTGAHRRPPWRMMRLTLYLTMFWWSWTAFLFWVAPLVDGGDFSYTACVIWTALASLPALLAPAPPPVLMSNREAEFIHIAVGEGASPDLASRIARCWFHGGDNV